MPPYYFLNLVAKKPGCAVVEQSDLFELNPGRWYQLIRNDPIRFTLRSSAEQEVDLWGDPAVQLTPFFSDRLAKAINAAKLRGIKLYECDMAG